MDDAIESAAKTRAISKQEIEQVLLVGGSSRIPRVRALLIEYMDHLQEKDIRSDINPDESVSRGAALVARKYDPSASFGGPAIDLLATGAITQADRDEATKIVLQDVTSHTLGILTHPDRFHPIIRKESRIPAEQTQGGFTNLGPSRSVDVMIYQGEDPIAFNNSLIGKLPIPLPEPRPANSWHFEVTFKLDSDGLLHVNVKRLEDNQEFPLKVQCAVRSSDAGLREGAQHLQQVMAGAPAEVPSPPPPPQAAAATASRPAATAPTPTQNAAATAKPVGVAPPPENTPEEFRSIARRAYKLLQQPLDPTAAARLGTAYEQFTAAVRGGGEVEDLGDKLGDVYIEVKR
jgi:molecular chaperone DnaK